MDKDIVKAIRDWCNGRFAKITSLTNSVNSLDEKIASQNDDFAQSLAQINSDLATKRIYAPILNWISDEILKSSASITNTKYGMVIFGMVTNNPSFPTLNWYYVMQISGGASGSNFKSTFAYNMTGAEDSKTLYVSYDYHTADTPTWRKFSAPTKL